MHCLCEQKLVSKADCHPWLEKFADLDKDNSGFLNAKDILTLAGSSAAPVVQTATTPSPSESANITTVAVAGSML
jgi:hypothetical protein